MLHFPLAKREKARTVAQDQAKNILVKPVGKNGSFQTGAVSAIRSIIETGFVDIVPNQKIAEPAHEHSSRLFSSSAGFTSKINSGLLKEFIYRSLSNRTKNPI